MIISYRRFYRRALAVSMIPCVAMITYIFVELLARIDNSSNRHLIIVIGIAWILLSIMITWMQYRHHTKICGDLLKEFEE